MVGEAERGLAEGGRAGGEPVDVAAPSSSEYSEWTCRCAQAWVLTEAPRLGAGSDASRAPADVAARCGNPRSGRLGAIQPRLEEGHGLAVAANDRAVAGGCGLAAEEVGEPIGGHRHGRVRAARPGACGDADALAVADDDVPRAGRVAVTRWATVKMWSRDQAAWIT